MPAIKETIETANAKVVDVIVNSKPTLVDVRRAMDVVPGMKKTMILHSGPPVRWDDMCGPQKGGVVAAAIYEGLASDWKEAEERVRSGEIQLGACHEHSSVGSMTGVTSASMWVHCVKNDDTMGYCAIYEGRGNTSAFGGYNEEVINRLQWMGEVLGPTLHDAVKDAGEILLTPIISKALMMGDECHNRNWAATLLFIDEINPHLISTNVSKPEIIKILEFITKPHYNYFLTLSMPACKSVLEKASNVPHSTIVTTMARNGFEFGIRVSGLGAQWFKAPAPVITGSYFPGFNANDANPDMGDSAITETAGLGAFALAAAPALSPLVGQTAADAINYTRQMGEITATQNPNYQIPFLEFQGAPTGIDIRKVIRTGIAPAIDTGIAHKEPGIGQIGAGITRAPIEAFRKAFEAFAKLEGLV